MKTLFTYLGLALITATPFISKAQSIKVSFERITTCNFNEYFSGKDTTFLLLGNALLKEWNPYDERFTLTDLNNSEVKSYYQTNAEGKKYFTSFKDTANYTFKKLEGEKTIHNYKCQKAQLISNRDTLEIYYTDELGYYYSPKGQVEGFVLEYTLKTAQFKYEVKAITLDENAQEGLYIPEKYKELSNADFFGNQYKRNKNQLEIEDKAPLFSYTDILCNPQDFKAYKGKVLVLNFWSLGCVECVKNHPFWNTMVDQYSSEGVEFFGITADLRSDLMKVIRNQELKFHLVPLENAFLNFSINSFPTTIIVDQKGKIVEIYNLPFKEEKDFELFQKDLKALFAPVGGEPATE